MKRELILYLEDSDAADDQPGVIESGYGRY